MPEKFADEPLLGVRFDRALAMAVEHHRVHLRKDTEIPYVSHLLAVTGIVLELGGGEDEAIAALLHDAVEDGGGPMMLGRIRMHFGSDVAKFVDENSDSDVDPKPPWPARKRAYLAAIPSKRPGSVLVSLADKLHNARAIRSDLTVLGDALWTRFNASPSQTVGYYAALAEAFRRSEAFEGSDSAACEAATADLRQLVDVLAGHAGVDVQQAKRDFLDGSSDQGEARHKS